MGARRGGHRLPVGTAATGKVTALEIGTGWVDQILVLVPDDAGRFHVALGGVYSYYEFQQPITGPADRRGLARDAQGRRGAPSTDLGDAHHPVGRGGWPRRRRQTGSAPSRVSSAILRSMPPA